MNGIRPRTMPPRSMTICHVANLWLQCANSTLGRNLHGHPEL